MTMPTVSVIVPNYNYGHFLKQRIDSILGQTYTDFEVIYLDDGSTDDSAQVMAAYADESCIQTVRSDANSGNPFVQWNKGVQLASGRYVWIAEADDYAEPEFLATLVPLLDAQPKVGLAYCQSRMVDELGRPLGLTADWGRPDECHRWSGDYVADGREECRGYLLYRNTIPNASAVLFRRELYQHIGGADESYRVSGDWAMWIAMLLKSDVAYCAQPLNCWRRHVRSTSGNDDALFIRAHEYYKLIAGLRPAALPAYAYVRATRHAVRLWCDATIAALPALQVPRQRTVLASAREADPYLVWRVLAAVPYLVQKLIIRRLLHR